MCNSSQSCFPDYTYCDSGNVSYHTFHLKNVQHIKFNTIVFSGWVPSFCIKMRVRWSCHGSYRWLNSVGDDYDPRENDCGTASHAMCCWALDSWPTDLLRDKSSCIISSDDSVCYSGSMEPPSCKVVLVGP